MARILVACERSGKIRDAFLALGHDAMSSDLQDTISPGPHYKGDVFDIIDNGWDLMIAHPPCTHLAVSGAAHFAKKRADGRQQQGIDLFMRFTKVNIPRWAIENPVGIMSNLYRPYDQLIHPWMFGDPYQKATCLWTKGLPKLIPTNYDAPLFGMTVDKGDFIEWVDKKTGKKKRQPKWYAACRGLEASERSNVRSQTFPGIAKAIATQWSAFIEKEGIR